MYFAASLYVITLLALTTSSIVVSGHGTPLLRREGRSLDARGILDSLFGKRDCASQFGPTWAQCMYNHCYQPSLGEICCGDGSYCLTGNFCTALTCCPNGLTTDCCNYSRGCPADVDKYYASASSAEASFKAGTWTKAAAAPTTAPATSAVHASTTLVATTAPAAVTTPAAVKTTTPIAASGAASSAGVVSSASSFTPITVARSSFASVGTLFGATSVAAAEGRRAQVGAGAAGAVGVVGLVVRLL